MEDITAQLRDRLLILLEQVKRDREALDLLKHAEGQRIYARLFDSLQATLHNLDDSQEGGKPLDDI